jgi:hypothetical protein
MRLALSLTSRLRSVPKAYIAVLNRRNLDAAPEPCVPLCAPAANWARGPIAADGIGGAAPGKGTGLRGLADRVEALGGTVTVSRPPGRGTTLRAEFPCG